jgi:glycosyltransferase involved in cell wall biosynthesis
MINISIIIPCYNNEDTLIDCLESCLNQTFDKSKYEIICVNDGSTDLTSKILLKYSLNYDNIVVIKKEHSGKADAINMGIKKSNGFFIMLLDPLYTCVENRLETQHNIMINNQTIDITFGGYIDTNTMFIPSYTELTFDELLITHEPILSTLMIRKDTLDSLPFMFENYYGNACDFKFICSCVKSGYNVKGYTQIFVTTNNTAHKHDVKQINRITNLYLNDKFTNKRELTVIIPFNNENIEIEKTIQSIFATTKHTKILLINDHSTDDYYYENLQYIYDNVSYHFNEERVGVAESRNIGVNLIDTEYFVLLDGHMRFYEDDWDLRIINLLKKYNNSIISSGTSVITKVINDENYFYIGEEDINKVSKTYGAKINLDNTQPRCFGSKWNTTELYKNEDNLIEIPSVLGAFYACSKTHWNNIHGLNGLVVYGLDEAMMSIKTWMYGGKCYVLDDFYVGHIYRKSMPYHVSNIDVAYNEYVCIKIFIPEEQQQSYIDNLYNRLDTKAQQALDDYIENHKNDLDIEIKYINENKVKSFESFKTFNDSL